MKKMKNLSMSLGPHQLLRLMYQYHLFHKDQQPVHKDQQPSSQGPASSNNSGDEHSECSDEYSAQSQDSGGTVLCPDLYVPTNDEHRTMMPETYKYAAAVGSFSFIQQKGDQQDMCNLTTVPSVQRSL